MEKDINAKKVIISLIAFIMFWAIITNAWGYSDFIFKNDMHNAGSYIYGYVIRILWVIPAMILIVKYSAKLRFDKAELFSCPKISKELIIVLVLSMSYVLISMFVVHRGFHFNNKALLWLVVKYLEVGFVEEIVFRGWGYNALLKYTSHIKAASITTVLFVILHWPAYFIKFYRFGIFDLAGIIGQTFCEGQ